jgi:serine/threonine-protein kinase
MIKSMTEVGEIVDKRYRIDAVIGGHGTVVAATHVQNRTKYAIKFLRTATADAVMRFRRGARLAAGITGEHACAVLDFGQLDNARPYLVMELLEGRDLKHALRDGPLAIADATRYVADAAAGLAALHAAGVVHRDIRPGHIFLTAKPDGALLVKLLDLGSATPLETGAPRRPMGPVALVGSPAYMAPEQAAGDTVDGRADLWSLGVTLYQALTARLPFEAETIEATCAAVVGDPPAPIESHRPDLPAALVAVIARCLDKQPAARFADATALAAALAPFAA